MASDKELRTWISDQLHSIVGYSDVAVADFILAKAKKAKDASSLVSSLAAVEFPANPTTKAFAVDLLLRLPQSRGSKVSEYSARQQQAKAFAKRNRGYALLDEDEELEQLEQQRQQHQHQQQQQSQQQTAAAVVPAVSKKHASRGDRHVRKHRPAGSGSDQEDDPTVVRSSKRSKRSWEEEDEETLAARAAEEQAAREEAEREADQKAKEEFEARYGLTLLGCTGGKHGWQACDVLVHKHDGNMPLLVATMFRTVAVHYLGNTTAVEAGRSLTKFWCSFEALASHKCMLM